MLMHDYDEKEQITQPKLKVPRTIHNEHEASVLYSARQYLLGGVGDGRVGVAKTSFHGIIQADD
jgi:hypothetical protein